MGKGSMRGAATCRKMSDLDKPAKCRAIYKIISGLSDIATQCAADSNFVAACDELNQPLVRDDCLGK
jgi:hypothetical protein